MDKGKKSFLWLVGLFVAPIMLGTLLFYNLDKLGFEKGSVNYGTLIQPAFPLKKYDLMQANTPVKREDTLSKKWTLMYIEPETCDQDCSDKLLLIKRVRLLMNEQMRRVRTVLVSSKTPTPFVPVKNNPNLVQTQLDVGTSEFIKQFPHLETTPVYLVDPLGNLMMYYPDAKPNAKKMIKDLNKLLKYSRLG